MRPVTNRTSLLIVGAALAAIAVPTLAHAEDHRCSSAEGTLGITRNADQIDVEFQCEGGSEHGIQSVSYTDPGSGDEQADNESICESLLEEFCPSLAENGGDGTRYTCEDESGVMLIERNADQLNVQYTCAGGSEFIMQSVGYTDPGSGDVDLDNESICQDQLEATCGDGGKFDDVETDESEESGGCSVTAGSPGGAAVMFGLVLWGLGRRRRLPRSQ